MTGDRDTFPDTEISPATATDAGAVSALMQELGYSVPPAEAVRRLERLAATGADPVFLFRRHGRALGLLSLHLAPYLAYAGRVMRIMSLVTAEEARGQGIGRALVAHAVALAREEGCEVVELTSNVARKTAHAFYLGLGFEQKALRFSLTLRRDGLTSTPPSAEPPSPA